VEGRISPPHYSSLALPIPAEPSRVCRHCANPPLDPRTENCLYHLTASERDDRRLPRSSRQLANEQPCQNRWHSAPSSTRPCPRCHERYPRGAPEPRLT
jgi:hypothetical protein